MPILLVVFLIAVIGFATYIVVTYVPMPAPIKQGLPVLVLILLVAWVLSMMGLFDTGPRVPHVFHN